MHSGKKGKSGSKAPAGKQLPNWIEYKPEEIEEVIINLTNDGYSASEIGMILRDNYGVPSVKRLTGKTIEKILLKHKMLPDMPQDLLNLIKKSVKLDDHLKESKKDFTAKRGYQLTVSKIRRLVKYYRKKGKLPKDWRYEAETAALLVK